jgi:CRP/FNR family cyclic AMP-dependent transcriptional regulator
MTPAGGVSDHLAGVSLFGGVPPALLDGLAAASSERTYAAGDRIFRRGDQGTSLYVVVEGRVRIEVVASSDRAFLLGAMGPGEVFGDLAVFDEGPRSADAVALEDTRCVVVPRAAVLSVAEMDGQLLDAVIRSFGALARRLTDRLTQLALLDTPGRLAAVLLDLAGEAPGHEVESVPLPLNQSDLARMIGASRQTTNQVLREFETRGYIVVRDRTLVIHDRPALLRRAQP